MIYYRKNPDKKMTLCKNIAKVVKLDRIIVHYDDKKARIKEGA